MWLKLRPRAVADIQRIYEQGVEVHGAVHADGYVDGLDQTIAMLAAYPGAARLREELSVPVRAFNYRAHIILYQFDLNTVTILRIRHAREDWVSDPL